MSGRDRVRVTLVAAVAALLVTAGGRASAQLHPIQPVQPINDRPNPYRTIDGWAKLPDGRTWGSTAGVDIDPDGSHVWAIDRCGANSCAGSTLDPILEFDPSGQVVRSFGGGLMIFPHGLHVDKDGNVWVTDARGPDGKDPNRDGKGHVVLKFSPEGTVLLTLGKPGVAGNGEGALLNTPCDVVTGPNGDIFVGDGHSGQNPDAPPDTVARIAKFSADGTFIKSWGKLGSGPGELRTPHALAFDSRGRLVVGDRGNNRLQVFDQEGRYLEEFKQFSRPSGFYITADDTLYVADSESAFDGVRNPGWKPGIRVGRLDDGSVRFFIDGTVPAYPDGSNPEGVAVDAAGNVYGAVVSGGGALLKSVKR